MINTISLIRRLILSPTFCSNIYIGMARLVQNPSELYHSSVWASSIRSTSGQFAR